MIRLIPMTYKEKELTDIAHWRNDTLISLRSNKPTDPKGQKKWVESFTSSERYFFIYDGDVFVGYCGLDKLDFVSRTAEMGLLIGPKYQRSKVGMTATKLLLQHGFYALDLNCIFIEVYQTTLAWSFWSKCGFRKEGELRERKFWKGVYCDSTVGSILKDEFGT